MPTFQSQADRAPHAILDAALPQLAQALDAQYMREVFERCGKRWRWDLSKIRRCSVTDTRYKPGHSCWITLELEQRLERGGVREAECAARSFGVVLAEKQPL
jgi:hypothetical protein